MHYARPPIIHRAMLALVALCSVASAQSEKTPEDVLKDKGLTKVNQTYLLEADAKLPESLRTVRQGQNKFDDYNKKRKSVEADLERIVDTMIQLGRQRSAVHDEMARTNKQAVEAYNELVSQENALVTNLREGELVFAKRRQEYLALTAPTEDLPGLTVDLANRMDEAAKRYEALGKDDAVTQALATINAKPGPKMRLGPSAQFTSELPKQRRQRDLLQASGVQFEIDGGVPQVRATINGNVTVPMVVDSGASVVTISSEIANQLGLKPGSSDAKVTLTVANGKQIDARLATLNSVRVGPYTVKNVICAVMPPEAAGGGNLLGGTFLKNFVYRMDLASRVLHLSPIASTVEKSADATVAVKASNAPTPDTSQSPPPATAPSSPEAAAPLKEGFTELLPTMVGKTDRTENGAIVLTGDERLVTPEMYRPRVSFRIVAMTDGTNLRLAHAAESIVFNWEADPTILRIDGGPVGGKHKAGAGKIPANQWVLIELHVWPDSLTIKVDGEQRYREKADFSKINKQLQIFPALGSTVKVKSVAVKITEGS